MERERLIEILGNKWRKAHPCDVIQVADLILSELAAEKPTAPAGVVEELRKWKKAYDVFPSMANDTLFQEILSRFEAHKEVVLTDGVLDILANDECSWIEQEIKEGIADIVAGKRVKLIAVETELFKMMEGK